MHSASARSCGPVLSSSWIAAAMLLGMAWMPARAAPPTLFHTSGYQAPVRGDPDDLLLLAGAGFSSTDRVVYAAEDLHPDAIPDHATAVSGIAPTVATSGANVGIIIRLPLEMTKGRAYRLWVVTDHGEWSQPASINDPRPLWFSPSYAWSHGGISGLGRTLRIVGRNLSTDYARAQQIRLRGPAAYTFPVTSDRDDDRNLPGYVAAGTVPEALVPGSYSVEIRRSDSGWIEVPGQKLEVRADLPAMPTFRLDSPAFGACHAGDRRDDSPCLAKALQAAASAGGGSILIPPGTWLISGAAGSDVNGFVLPPGVNLVGTAGHSTLARTDPLVADHSTALLTLMGRNSVSGLHFTDEAPFTSLQDVRPVIRLGPGEHPQPRAGSAALTIVDVVISDNDFDRVGRAVSDSAAWPLNRLIVTHNRFAAFTEGLHLAGGERPDTNFQLADSVVRDNRFVPGSFVDKAIRQGTIGSEIGAAQRLDFSANVADGADTSGLLQPDDQRGFRAAFFWNMNSNLEQLLVSRNRISCSGDKVGDGEALAFDNSGSHAGFAGAPAVSEAGTDWVRVRGSRLIDSKGFELPRSSYYLGQWVQVVAGPGLGQVRRITAYREDPGGGVITLRVAPDWDVMPAPAAGRIQVTREMWQAAIVDNDIESGEPVCRKSNLTTASSGQITLWLPSADSAVTGNRQHDASGIMFLQTYLANTPSCPNCENALSLQTSLEIRDNRIEGEYDWASDCSQSGIMGFYSASPTPESLPSVAGFGTSISHNLIQHADGLGGGAIDFVPSWHVGPAPGHWSLVESPLIFHNDIRDIEGPGPGGLCRSGQRDRVGIRLGEPANVAHAVLYANRCRNVSIALRDLGSSTTRLCPGDSAGSCECPAR